MSTVAPPSKPINPVLLDSEHYIDAHISRTRRSLKLIDLAAGLLTLVIGLLAFVLAAAVIDHWIVPGGLNTAGRTALFVAFLAGVAWYGWRQFLPLLRPINPVFAAQTIERGAPSLKNSLLNLLIFRRQQRGMSARLYHALEQQTALRLSTTPVDGSIDRSGLLRLGYALLAIVAACAAYAVFSPKDMAASAGRVLAPWLDIAAPSRVKILDVRPGEFALAKGQRAPISAEVHGLHADERVRVRFTSLDEQIDDSIAMSPDKTGHRYEATLPRGGDRAAAESGVLQDLEYWIEAGDARSRRYRLSVFNQPTIIVQQVRYEYPAYTGYPSKETDSTGDLRGLEGTRVYLSALANQKIKTAYVDFDADGENDLKMDVEGDRASASFVLALRKDRRTAEHESYLLRYTSTEGRTNVDPPTYRIEVTPDYAPEVSITTQDEAERTVKADETLVIGVEARDPDFALSQVELAGRVGQREVHIGALLANGPHAGRFGHDAPFTPVEAGLKPGDVLEYWAVARDNRTPAPNEQESEHRRLKIAGPAQPPKNGQQQQGGQQQGDSAEANGNNSEQGEEQNGGAGAQGQKGDESKSQPQDGDQGASSGSDDAQAQPQEGDANSAAGGASDNAPQQQDGNPPAGSANAGGNAAGQQSSPQGGDQDQQNPADGSEASQGHDQSADQPQGGPAGGQQRESEKSENGQPQKGQTQKGQTQNGQPPSGQPQGQQQRGEEDGQGDSQQQQQQSAQPGNKQSNKLSSDGSEDASAFQKISDFLKGKQQGPQQSGEQQQGGKQPAGDQQPAGGQQQAGDQQPAGGQQQAGDQQPAGGQQQAGDRQEGADRSASADQENQQSKQGREDETQGGDSQTQPADGTGSPAQAQDAGRQAQHPGEVQAPSGDQSSQEAARGGAADAQQQAEQKAPAGEDQPGGRREEASDDEQRTEAGANSTGRPGADTPRETKNGDGNPGQPQGEKQPSGDSGMNRDDGNAGSGHSADEQQGSPASDEVFKRGGQKHDVDNREAMNDEEPPGASPDKKESDSRGGMSGEQSGGGQEGAGQKADAQGRGDAGQHEASDEGAGRADEQGRGETGSDGGRDQLAPGKTGQSSGDQQGAGSEQGETGAEQASQAGAEEQAPGEEKPGVRRQPEGSRPAAGQQAAPEAPQRNQQSAPPESGDQSQGQQTEGQPSGPEGNPRTAGSGQPSGGGPAGANAASAPQTAAEEQAADAANLDYARQQTNLMLERLDEQLAKKQVDKDLLKTLGWTEDELRRFVDRWKDLKDRAASATKDSAGHQELDAALRSLGLRPQGPTRFRADAAADKIRDLKEGVRKSAPLEYAERVREFQKSIAEGQQGQK
ncbi:MAG: hypothetical protein IT424_02975 [Pirellulales bacterium]|nr:hypothetical protein [Pirellulales bacterium]